MSRWTACITSVSADIGFGEEVYQPLLGVTFPASLQTSTFGGLVNDPLDGVNYPASLLTWGF